MRKRADELFEMFLRGTTSPQDPQKEDKTFGENTTNDDRFMKIVKVTGKAYDEALRRLAEGAGIKYGCRR